jgi:hypothetical protein
VSKSSSASAAPTILINTYRKKLMTIIVFAKAHDLPD